MEQIISTMYFELLTCREAVVLDTQVTELNPGLWKICVESSMNLAAGLSLSEFVCSFVQTRLIFPPAFAPKLDWPRQALAECGHLYFHTVYS